MDRQEKVQKVVEIAGTHGAIKDYFQRILPQYVNSCAHDQEKKLSDKEVWELKQKLDKIADGLAEFLKETLSRKFVNIELDLFIDYHTKVEPEWREIQAELSQKLVDDLNALGIKTSGA